MLKKGLPRASGGVSLHADAVGFAEESSPRKRGCFRDGLFVLTGALVFPAQAGVFLLALAFGFSAHASSPRKRGCFAIRLPPFEVVRVFPAQAGVFPTAGTFHSSRASLPRASGGVSISTRSKIGSKSLPRASGGVSLMSVRSKRPGQSSPRKRGCFLDAGKQAKRGRVFPAQAGVFPLWTTVEQSSLWSSPRKRGGFLNGWGEAFSLSKGRSWIFFSIRKMY